MSLTALPVVVSDLTALQQGIQFFTNTVEATAEEGVINNPASGQSVFTYAASLLNSNISLSQVAMAVGAIAESGTLAVGAAATPNTLTHFTMQSLPPDIAFAAANHLNQTVFAAEALGEDLSSTAGFKTDWGSLSATAFVTAVSNATGIHTAPLTTWLTYWTGLFAGNTAEAYGATLGDAIGTALINPTSANLEISRFTLFEGATVTALLDPAPVERAVVLAAVSLGRRVRVLEYPDGACAVSLGPHGLADDEQEGGSLPRPDYAQDWRRARGGQGQALSGALARVLDRPCARRQFRCAKPGRGNGRPAEQGNRPTLRDRRGMTPFSKQGPRASIRWMKGGRFAAGRSRSHSHAL
jgi:hypothetical protein